VTQRDGARVSSFALHVRDAADAGLPVHDIDRPLQRPFEVANDAGRIE
jgi:hypothetical protein